MKKNYVFLDMDGVLADFNAEIIKRFGKPFVELGQTAQDRWNTIADNDHEFLYAHLDEMLDADMLVQGVLTFCKHRPYIPAILTALPHLLHMPEAEDHKKQWLKQRWPILLEHFNIGPFSKDKVNFARPGDILIDDRIINIEQWRAAGGIGIHYHNARQVLHILNNL